MWLPLMPKLADSHTVIAVDLRGAGQSALRSGFTKAAMAQDIHALAQTWVTSVFELSATISA